MIEFRWLADPQVRRGAVITLLVALLAAFGPWLAPHAPMAMVGPVYGLSLIHISEPTRPY